MSMNRSRAVMATDTSRAVNNTVGNASGTRTVQHAHRGMERTFHWTFFFDPLVQAQSVPRSLSTRVPKQRLTNISLRASNVLVARGSDCTDSCSYVEPVREIPKTKSRDRTLTISNNRFQSFAKQHSSAENSLRT